MTLFYRFRSPKSLLDEHRELERQSIYFARPEQLNDPMEGFRDIFWAGDHIAWKNLFVHYLRCLERVYMALALAGDAHPKLSAAELRVDIGIDQFPTDRYRRHFEEIRTEFLANKSVADYIAAVTKSGRKARRDELRFHLQNIHLVTLQSVTRIYEKHGLKAPASQGVPRTEEIIEKMQSGHFFDLLEQVADKPENGDVAEALFQAGTHVNAQSNLIHRCNQPTDPATKNKNFLVMDFPAVYVRAIETLVFPPWYTACFMSECRNSAVWGHYGASHTGICLIFESEKLNGRDVLRLHGTTGWGGGGPIRGVLPLEFRAIDYSEGFGEIDFFRSIGRLPVPVLNSTWYSDGQGRLSDCAQDLLSDEQGWRDRYWARFLRDVQRKTPDWSYEKEYRLILSEVAIDRSDPRERTLTYDFSSLKGLIFGMNTSMEDKISIVKIIGDKCAQHGRTDFSFYQASYDPKERCIRHTELSLIRFKGGANTQPRTS